MRANNLQELVYKNGQAGINKASVTITFDNRDKKNSPIGYDQYDEVVIQRQVCLAFDFCAQVGKVFICDHREQIRPIFYKYFLTNRTISIFKRSSTSSCHRNKFGSFSF